MDVGVHDRSHGLNMTGFMHEYGACMTKVKVCRPVDFDFKGSIVIGKGQGLSLLIGQISPADLDVVQLATKIELIDALKDGLEVRVPIRFIRDRAVAPNRQAEDVHSSSNGIKQFRTHLSVANEHLMEY